LELRNGPSGGERAAIDGVEHGLPELRSHASDYGNVAGDLEVLSAALHKAWPQIAGKSPLTLATHNTALELARQLRESTPCEQVRQRRAAGTA
jgi:hypothetical protein